jgi:phosphoribosylglycinamide formyltransferase 1
MSRFLAKALEKNLPNRCNFDIIVKGTYMNIAVFCSGSGSNLQAIIDASRAGAFEADVAVMICDNPDAYAIERAVRAGIPHITVKRKDFFSKDTFEKKIIDVLEERQIGLICLAGYMRLLSPGFVKRYAGRIINIHPALLPAFKGVDAIKYALDYGVKVSGVTVHFVTEDVDAGPVILQEPVKINDSDTREDIADKIHRLEHRLYPQAIRFFVEGRLKITGRRVEIIYPGR